MSFFFRPSTPSHVSCVPCRHTLTLGPGDVLVLGLSLDDADATKLRVILDGAERLRAAAFVYEVHRQRFTVAHAALRLALAHMAARSPRALRFRNGAYGKPELADPDNGLRFNLSHAGSRALIAVARGREVGIDIEQERLVEPLELSRLCFSRRERSALQRLSASERLHAFFRGWTRKESFIKANGRGFSYPLDSFDVSLDESPENVLLAYLPADDEPERRWQMQSVGVEARFAAAITVEGTDWRLVSRETSIPELEELAAIHTSR
jgi:4'-phosphopantetheinyl transferase